MKKKYIVLVSIVVAILLVLSIILVIKNIIQDDNNKKSEQEKYTYVMEASKKLEEVKSVNSYQTMENIIEKFLNYIKDNNIEALKEVLIEQKIELSKIEYDFEYLVESVNKYEPTIMQTIYLVDGKIINKDNYQLYDYNFIIIKDEKNSTFKIAPQEKVYLDLVDYKNKKISDKIEKEIKEIQLNDYNSVKTVNGLGDKEIVAYYFKQFSLNMLYNTEEAFNTLNSEYSRKRFGTIETFKNYIDENKEDLQKSVIMKWKIKTFNEYKEYSCIDNYNNMYIFLEKEPMEYKVLLDEYTIDDKIVENEYITSNEKVKAQINLDKFMHMLNRKDFQAAYNVLDKEFKEQYFNTLEDFKNYLKENIFNYNEFTYEEVARKGEKAVKFKTIITDKLYESNKSVTKRFIVSFLEDGKFSISFDI